MDEVISNICDKFKIIENNVKTPDIELIKQSITAEINKKIEIINSLDNLIATDILDQQTASIRNYQLQTEISQLKIQLAQLPPNNLETIAKTLSLKQFWYDLSEEERRFYLREFIQSIKINPHHKSQDKCDLNLDLYFSNSSLNNQP